MPADLLQAPAGSSPVPAGFLETSSARLELSANLPQAEAGLCSEVSAAVESS